MKNSLFLILLFSVIINSLNAQALDDIVQRSLLKDRKLLKYPPIREADILWEKRIWRVIDVREKMNQPFMYPPAPFFRVLQTAALNGDISLYSTENDQFTLPLTEEETENIFFQRDTFEIIDPQTGETTLRAGVNSINWEEIKRFRVKEVWFF